MKEARSISAELEVRSSDDGKKQFVSGYALKFNRWSDTLGGWFREIIDPQALENADMSNVVALFNHDENKVLARSGINLNLSVDAIGLRFEFEPNNTSYAKDLMENIRTGIVSQCSFAFSIPDERGAEEWQDGPEGIMQRRIKRFDKIYDISAVVNPAYPDTNVSVGARSKELADEVNQTKIQESLKAQEQERELEILEMEYEFLTHS